MGLAWYSSEAWKQLERRFAAQGIEVEKVSVDIDHMVEWCRRRGYEPDDKGRSIYGVMLLMTREYPDALDAPVIDNTQVVQ
jgi:hypothetical protein